MAIKLSPNYKTPIIQQRKLHDSQGLIWRTQGKQEIARTLQKYANNSAESIQDTYRSLSRVANIQSSLDDEREALENNQEALSLPRQVQQLLGDTPTTLRNICVTLARIADIQVEMGQQQNALDNY